MSVRYTFHHIIRTHPSDEEEGGRGEVEGAHEDDDGAPLARVEAGAGDAPPLGNEDEADEGEGLVQELGVDQADAHPEGAVALLDASGPEAEGEEHHGDLG